jgi:hypothetical protein
MRLSLLASFAAGVLLSACGIVPPPAPEQLQAARAAPRPSSDDAARKAVVGYFTGTLGVPQSARFAFNGLVNGAVRAAKFPQAGWFMCGDVSPMDKFGRYGPPTPFLAHFDPANPDMVREGLLEQGDYEVVASRCRDVYGTAYLPR